MKYRASVPAIGRFKDFKDIASLLTGVDPGYVGCGATGSHAYYLTFSAVVAVSACFFPVLLDHKIAIYACLIDTSVCVSKVRRRGCLLIGKLGVVPKNCWIPLWHLHTFVGVYRVLFSSPSFAELWIFCRSLQFYFLAQLPYGAFRRRLVIAEVFRGQVWAVYDDDTAIAETNPNDTFAVYEDVEPPPESPPTPGVYFIYIYTYTFPIYIFCSLEKVRSKLSFQSVGRRGMG